MDQKPSNRRRAPRFPIQVAVIVRKLNGEIWAAQAGRVVRLDGHGPAIQLHAGSFAEVLAREAEGPQ